MAKQTRALPVITSPPIGTPPESTTSATMPLGARVYVSVQGDFWDTIAMRVYGMKRGNEHLMFRLIEANYHLRNLSLFPAGVGVIVPAVEVATEIPLVPWKSATIVES